ncbi:MAG: 30S ribosomal protein S8 [Spirochaetes bacterium]|nr:30S ribosomal protein S8 [Spirochaetota bacterium]
MSFTDPISQLLINLKNAQLSKIDHIEIYYSKMIESILNILKNKGFIEDYKISDENTKVKKISIILKYEDNKPVIRGVQRVSKPSRRIYKSLKEIKPVFNGYAVSVYSTNKGILTDKEAIRNKVGGEFLFYIW